MINKKIIAMGLTVTMLITSSACTQDTSTKDKAQDENNQTEEEVIQSEESSEETDGEEDVLGKIHKQHESTFLPNLQVLHSQ